MVLCHGRGSTPVETNAHKGITDERDDIEHTIDQTKARVHAAKAPTYIYEIKRMDSDP